MSHHLASPSSQPPMLPQDCGPDRRSLPSPGLAALTRRYLDGEVDLRQLLAFDGAASALRRSPH